MLPNVKKICESGVDDSTTPPPIPAISPINQRQKQVIAIINMGGIIMRTFKTDAHSFTLQGVLISSSLCVNFSNLFAVNNLFQRYMVL